MEMKIEAVKRLDHLGIVAGTIKHLGIVKLVDELIGTDKQEDVSAGEVVAAMIINGLGFVSKPLTLAPQFFEHKPLDLLIREGVEADQLNRHKIGRVLDDISEYGTDKLFGTIAREVCRIEKVETKVGYNDTTSYSVSGKYNSETDTQKLTVTYGYSKAKRPDLKQIMQELMTSADSGIPFMMKTLSGNASDSVVLRERAEMLVEEFGKSTNRLLASDAKLYNQKSAKTLNQIYYTTRVPASLALTKTYINKALENSGAWQQVDDKYKLQEFAVSPYDIEGERWIVLYSEHAYKLGKETLKTEVAKEKESIDKQLFHLQAQRFSCKKDAEKKFKSIAKKWKYHEASNIILTSIKHHEGRGRPKVDATYIVEWQINAEALLNQVIVDRTLAQRACFVLSTNVEQENLPAPQVLPTYKGLNYTEKGFAFLKCPEFFVSSFFLKKTSRIDAMLMIMVLALLVYTIAQRRLRLQLTSLKLTLPNQIKKEVQNPTMRWVFQLFDGINYITTSINGVITNRIQGLKDLQIRIIRLLSPDVQKIYQFSGT